MSSAMQDLLEQECPGYFSAENIERMKKDNPNYPAKKTKEEEA